MTDTIETIIEIRNAGLISDDEGEELLDQQGIRGAWRGDGSFIGYNYRSQEWIDTAGHIECGGHIGTWLVAGKCPDCVKSKRSYRSET